MSSSTLRRATMFGGSIAWCTAFVIAASTASQPAPSPSPVPRVADRVFTDPAQSVQVRAGQIFLIALAANPSTGYRWVVATPPDAPVADLKGSAYQAVHSGLMGAPGQDVFVCFARGAGTTTIALNYVAPGRETTVGKTVRFRVVVVKP